MATGYSGRMTREDVPDEVPVADALEQQREQIDAVPDAEAPVSDVDSPPLEATEPDWQEQREVVTGDDEFDHEDGETLPG